MVTSTGDIEPPDAAYCEVVRSTYGLTMSVLFDPDNVVEQVLGVRVNSGALVLAQGNVIRYNGGPDHDAIDEALVDIFGY